MINFLLNNFDENFDNMMRTYSNISLTTTIVYIVITLFMLAIIIPIIVEIVRFFKRKKSDQIGEAKNAQDKDLNDNKTDVKEQSNTHIDCEYCGTSNDKNKTTCTNCGAALNRKK